MVILIFGEVRSLTLSKRASYQFHQFHPKPFLSVFTHLATSLVFDLGLNKPVQVTPSTFNLHQCPRPSTPRTMEERRAALGCYLMTSMYVKYILRTARRVIDHLNRISSFLQKIETIRWTTHLDESLQTVGEQKECLNDNILVQLVRMRLIVEKNRTRRASLNDTSEAVGPAEDEAALFLDVKVEILNSSPRDGTHPIPCLLRHYISPEANSLFSPLTASL